MSSKKDTETKKDTIISSKVEKVKDTNKYVNPRNYFYAFLILVGGIVFTLLIFKWYNGRREEKLMISYLISSNTIESSISDINSISLIRQEAPSSYFIYIGYTKDEEVYNFEKDLKKLIDKYKLNDIFYYVDCTKYVESNDNYIDLIKKNLDITEIDRIPAIIYIKNDQVKEVLDGVKNTPLKIDDVKQLLDIYEFETIK